jgi:hypothetical protein
MIFLKSWHLFPRQKAASNLTAFPRNAPQLHHKNTTAEHYLF